MLSIRRCVTIATRSPSCLQRTLSITNEFTKFNRFSTESLEKTEELKLSYLTGEKQGVAVIELNREKGKNSLSKSLVTKLHHSVDVLAHDKNVRVVIIR